jgi:hypothetical protein
VRWRTRRAAFARGALRNRPTARERPVRPAVTFRQAESLSFDPSFAAHLSGKPRSLRPGQAVRMFARTIASAVANHEALQERVVALVSAATMSLPSLAG